MSQMALSTLNFPVKLLLVMNILSLGGLPPFLGFSVKIFSVLVLVNFFPLPILILLIMTSVFTLVFYLSMIFPFSTLANLMSKIKNNNSPNPLKINAIFPFILILNLSLSILILLT